MLAQTFDGPDYAMHLKDCLKDLNPKDTISKEAVDVVLYNPGTGVNLTLVDLPGHVSRPSLAKPGVPRSCEAWPTLAALSMAKPGASQAKDWPGQAKPGQARPSLAKPGQDWLG